MVDINVRCQLDATSRSKNVDDVDQRLVANIINMAMKKCIP
jgi:hypothetical protein